MYYQLKVKFYLPKEGSDQLEKKNKTFLVESLSCAESEGKGLSWIPDNYQDPCVTGCSESKIIDVRREFGDSETWWEVIMGDENEKGRLIPFHIAVNGSNHMQVLKKLDSLYSTSEFIGIKRLNAIVEDELVKSSS